MKSKFEELYQCEFKVDERLEALRDRLNQYYKETENFDNKYAMNRWRAFKEWASGYTQDEINRAKRDLRY